MNEPDPQPRVDPEHPWPALLSFREDDQRYFGGREEEVEALYRRIGASRLTLLFGLSGLGKTSLLRAGLFPRLRGEHYFPVYIRLRYGKDLPTPLEQIKSEIAAQARASRIEAPGAAADETLWEYFHRPDADFWDERNYPSIPVLVFDQFEELFTKGREVPEQAHEVIEELADLAEGASPALLREAAARNPSLLRQVFDERYRLLIGIRSDYLAQLQGISDRVRAVFANRYELHRMSGAAALKSTLTAGGHLLDEEVARHVVRFVAGARDGEGASSVAGLEVEPALLSLVCSELNATRIETGEPKITASMLSGTKDEILSRFYETSMADVAPELRVLVEDKLVTRDGKGRNFISEQTARETPGVTEEDLGKLVHRRLLRFEESGTSRRMELTHDLLTTVAAASRASREHRLQIEEAQRATAEAEQREATARRALRRSRAAVLVFLVLLAAAVAGPFIASRWTASGAKKVEAEFYYGLALQTLASDEPSEGLAHLARVIRLDRGNAAARTLLYQQLATRSWPVPIRTFGPEGRIADFAFSDDGARVAFRVGQNIEIWDTARGQRIGRVDAGFEPKRIAFASDGRTLVFDPGIYGWWPGGLALWNPELARSMTFEDVRKFPGLSDCRSPRPFDVSADGKELAVGCYGALRIVALGAQRPIEIPAISLSGHLNGTRFGPDPRFLVVLERFTDEDWDHSYVLDRKSQGRTTREERVGGLTRDGKRAATMSRAGNSVVAHDLDSEMTIGFSNQSPTRSAIFSGTGTAILTTSEDDGIRLWNVEKGQMVFNTLWHPRVRVAEFSADDARIFSASDRRARWWNARDGTPLGEALVQPKMIGAHLDARGNLATVSKATHTWQLVSAVLPPVLAEPILLDFLTDYFYLPRVVHSADRKTVIVRGTEQGFGGSQVLAGFDTATGKRRWTAPGFPNYLAFDAQGSRGLGVDGEGALTLVDVPTGKHLWTRRDRSYSYEPCSFSSDGTVLVVEGPGKMWPTVVLSAATGEPLDSPITGARGRLRSMTRDGSRLAFVSEKVIVRDVRERRTLLAIPVKEAAQVDFSPDGKRLAVLTSRALEVWDLATGAKRSAKLEDEDYFVALDRTAALFSPDGRQLAVASENGVALCDADTLDCTRDVLPHPDVNRVELSKDGQRLLTMNKQTMRVWEVATRRPLTLPIPRTDFAALSPDGTSLFLTIDEQLRRVPIPSIAAVDADRLAKLGEALAGVRVDRLGDIEPIEGTAALARLGADCQAVGGPVCDLVRWLRTAPEKRTISPASRLTIAEHVRQQRRMSLDWPNEWWRLKALFPNEPALGPKPSPTSP